MGIESQMTRPKDPHIKHEIQAGGLDITLYDDFSDTGLVRLQIRKGRMKASEYQDVIEGINLSEEKIDELIIALFAYKRGG